MKPVCVPCRRFYRPEKNGIHFIEGMPVVYGALPGLVDDEKWKPYKLWCGDLWKCEGCGAEIISGVARQPRGVQHEPDFAETVKQVDDFQRHRVGPMIKINDC